MRLRVVAGLLLAGVSVSADCWAQAFDVAQATRSYLDLVHGTARAKSDAYFEGGYWLILWDAVIGMLVYWTMLETRVSAALRNRIALARGRNALALMLYALGFTVIATLLALPWTIYSGFIRETQYGLMSQSFGAWLGDQAKVLLITLIVAPLAFLAVFAVIRRAPRLWWLWGAVIAWSFMIFATAVAPVLVFPLFYDFAEMPSGPLRERIVTMARENQIPSEHVYVVDASRKSKRIAAAISGLGPTTVIAMTDTLLTRTSPDEVVAVMGHEMGHYKLHHLWRRGVLFGLLFVAMFFAVAKATPALIARRPRWRVNGVSDVAAAPALLLVATAILALATPLQNTIIRTEEAQADAFGLNAARQPDAFALIALRLSEYRKLEPGPIEEFLFFDHPSGEIRIRRSMQWKNDHVAGAAMARPSLPADEAQ